MEFEMVEQEIAGKTIIKVVGVGGAGGNAVQHMIRRSVHGVDFICMNTDAGALQRSQANINLQLGETGLGAGAKPEVGAAAAEQARARIADVLQGATWFSLPQAWVVVLAQVRPLSLLKLLKRWAS
jgi:cell division protein FtsZ